MKYEKAIEKLGKKLKQTSNVGADPAKFSEVIYETKYPQLVVKAICVMGLVEIFVVLSDDTGGLISPREYPEPIKTVRAELLKHGACHIQFYNKTSDQVNKQRINRLCDILGAPQ